MADARYCPKCGAALPPGANFCPSCGTASGAVLPPSPPGSRSPYLVWVPIAVVALALLGWAVLAGMPFGREPRRPERPAMEVVTEGAAPSGTVTRIGEPEVPAMPTESLQEPERPLVEISEAEALRSLRGYILSRADYAVSSACLTVSGTGYRNAGYGFEAFDRCRERSLGRWRVDSEDATGIFLQRSDGRYLRP